MIQEALFHKRTALFEKLARDCLKYLEHALVDHGIASLLVSGGNTPAPLYRILSESDLAWHKVHVALVDERWVNQNNEASNEALIRRTLLTNMAEKAPFIGMKNNATSAAEGWAATEARYRNLTQPFTLAILGMGADGHTASLFPQAKGLSIALDAANDRLTAPIIARESAVTGPNLERMSLTLAGLLRCEHLILLLTGADKLAVYRSALTEGPVEKMPIRALLRQNKVPVDLYWAP